MDSYPRSVILFSCAIWIFIYVEIFGVMERTYCLQCSSMLSDSDNEDGQLEALYCPKRFLSFLLSDLCVCHMALSLYHHTCSAIR